MYRAAMRTAFGVVLLAAIAVGGCANESQGGGPAGPGLVAHGVLEDLVGDIVDQGSRAPRLDPRHIDLKGIEATTDGANLQLTLALAGPLPESPKPDPRLTYNIMLHTDVDAVPAMDGPHTTGYFVTVSSDPPSGYQPSLVLWDGANPVQLIGPTFPGTLSVAGDRVTVTIPLSAIGDPRVIRLGVAAYATGIDPTGVQDVATTEDQLPDTRPGDDQGWLTLGP